MVSDGGRSRKSLTSWLHGSCSCYITWLSGVDTSYTNNPSSHSLPAPTCNKINGVCAASFSHERGRNSMSVLQLFSVNFFLMNRCLLLQYKCHQMIIRLFPKLYWDYPRQDPFVPMWKELLNIYVLKSYFILVIIWAMVLWGGGRARSQAEPGWVRHASYKFYSSS